MPSVVSLASSRSPRRSSREDPTKWTGFIQVLLYGALR